MSRYIDAEKLLGNELIPLSKTLSLCHPKQQKGVNMAIRIIKNAPTADVAEVRHGEWKDDEEDVYWGNYIVKKHCSECGYTPHFDRETELFDLSNYCPSCGAQMDGDEK